MCMLKFADLAEKDMEKLALLESIAMGKPLKDLLAFDIPHMVGCYRCKMGLQLLLVIQDS